VSSSGTTLRIGVLTAGLRNMGQRSETILIEHGDLGIASLAFYRPREEASPEMSHAER